MSFGLQEKDTPPASPVDWAVHMPSQDFAEDIEARALCFVVSLDGPYVRRADLPAGKRKISRRIPRAAYVTAKTWFEARRDACRYWASKGVHFNPQSIRKGTVLP